MRRLPANLLLRFIGVLLLLMLTQQGFAQMRMSSSLLPGAIEYCDYCLASQGISPLEVGSTGVRADLRYLTLGTIYQDGKKVENDGHELETHLTQQYSLYFSLSPRFSIGAFVPIAKRHSEELNDTGGLVTGNEF